jgi:hypothetical protein
MKIFQVRIDNDPGGWKSGDDTKILVLADTEDEAIDKLKNGWGYVWGHETGDTYGFITDKTKNGFQPYISEGANLYATEIKFEGFEIVLTTELEKKLKRILKDENKN